MTPQEERVVAIIIVASVFVGFVVGGLAGYILGISQPQPPSTDTMNKLTAIGIKDGKWMMANRYCGYPNLTYGDPYSDICCITEDRWYTLNNDSWVRMESP